MLAKIENVVFGNRKIILGLFLLATIFMAYQTSLLRIDAGFEKQLPLKHPYMQTFVEHKEEFGGANRLLIAVRAKEGDIFTPDFFSTMKAVTDEVFFLPGVNRSTVRSIFTPNVRFIEIVEGGFSGGNVIPAEFTPTPEYLAEVRENILKSGIVGRLVADDFTTAMVSAQLVEIDPATGERLDYLKVAEQLEAKIRERFVDDEIDIHIIGFAKAVGDIADGALGVVLFFGIAFLITAAIVYLFTHSVRMTLLPLLCSLVAVVWNMGLLTLFGFGLDPMSILVPFLVFAIGVSHGVQMINAVGAEVFDGADNVTASRTAFRRLLLPGGVALLSDTIGFLTILLIEIRIIQELAITASLGVMVIILTNLILLPILLSYIKHGEGYRKRMHEGAKRREPLWRFLSRVADPKVAMGSIACALLLLAWGLYEAPNLKIGDIHAGVPELRQDSRYNVDTAVITDKFAIGVDVITTIVETVPDGCIEHDIMDRIDRFQWQMSNVPGVQSTISMPQVAKVINAGWNEGNPKWRVLPRNPQTMVQAVSSIETSTGLLNKDCSVLPVLIFTEDHKAETIERVIDAVKVFAAENNSERHTFRLATGNVGVMAATNEVVQAAQTEMLLWIYAAIIVLCFATFRSWRATLCIVLPLSLVSVLGYAVMSVLGIGLKISTLPVAALGVGIGVDYGIYIFSRFRTLLNEKAMGLHEAYEETLRVTGSAVLITGLTLAISVSTWAFSALKFQADMGVLLAFMFLANMLGALLLLPALAFVVYGFIRRKPTA
ncbi:efflux RND transporter permease subunit [Denitrobaculum tricleocarpae]|uniref:RND family transporter n=1 Tax=Denitrobaculum tricleocarpae TaxID=2591009 RepID=A0A545TP73_9PROT|nr:MMPL family transporter [Denitrobaculum tricleocarpae]TQV79030.1 RND family transporter [Denitrobaculum tricleocarpae]